MLENFKSYSSTFSQNIPYRDKCPTSDKIFFLFCEGRITEEEYFHTFPSLFYDIKSKVQFISLRDVISARIQQQKEKEKFMSKGKFWQLVDGMERFKEIEDRNYEFDKHGDDEFWIIADVDDCWMDAYDKKWEKAIEKCKELGYQYAISNPFFELWLLLHYDDVNDEDRKYAVLSDNGYKKTDHFTLRLKYLDANIKRKHIDQSKYDKKNVLKAAKRAKELHGNLDFDKPKALTTTVFRLIENIVALEKNFVK